MKGTVILLCAAGLYASAHMYRKAKRAERGELSEPSVVESGRARALGGTPNAAFGIAYYLALPVALAFDRDVRVRGGARAASLAAAGFSVYLAYSLLFVTRMPCPYCWTSHAINWTLPFLLARM